MIGYSTVRLTTFLIACAGLAATAHSGPIPPSVFLRTERDIVVVAEWKAEKKEFFGPTTFRIIRLAKSHKEAALKANDNFLVPGTYSAKNGQRFLVTGRVDGRSIRWGRPWEFSETRLKYLSGAPSKRVSAGKRIAYFLPFLDHADDLIAEDAHIAFSYEIPFKDQLAAAKTLPKERLRKMVVAKPTNPWMLARCAILLGLCGDASDADILERKVRDVGTGADRFGVDGVIIGYLWLKGESGLRLIDETKLSNKKCTFLETYSAMQSLRFLWKHGGKRFRRERLRQSMRLVADRPEIVDIVLNDLAEMKDWSVQDEMVKRYGRKPYDKSFHKRAIVRYVIAAANDRPKSPTAILPLHAAKANRHLADLEAKDPKTVKQVRKWYY